MEISELRIFLWSRPKVRIFSNFAICTDCRSQIGSGPVEVIGKNLDLAQGCKCCNGERGWGGGLFGSSSLSTKGMNKKFYSNQLFSGIPPVELEHLDILIEEVTFDTDDIVFEEGSSGADLWLVVDGTVTISKKGRGGNQEILANQQSDGFFGELALVLNHQSRTARATAAEPSLLGRMDETALHKLLTQSPTASLNLIRVVAGRLSTLNSLFIDKLLRTERLSLVGSMMSAMVHDFRNPIATISMTCDYLGTQNDEPVLLQLSELTRDATNQMLSMIRELLDFSKGASNIEPQLESVPRLIGSLDDQVLNRLAESRIKVRREIEFGKEMHIDRNRILRVLTNVINNAADAMSDGGVLTVSVREIGPNVDFAIADTGCGIPPDILSQIFEPFVTHGKSNGTGLGMAIAKSVVEAHKGEIRMQSQVGVGSSCHISLPINGSVAGQQLLDEEV